MGDPNPPPAGGGRRPGEPGRRGAGLGGEPCWPRWPESWLAGLSTGIGRRLPDGPGGEVVAEALAAGFTHGERGAVGAGFAAGGAADRLVPGPVLAEFAARAWADGLGALDDDEVVGVLCGWRRLASWAMAGELAAVSVLAGRRGAAGPEGREPGDDGRFDEEIAAALTLTGRAASRVTGLAAGLARLPGTAAALAAGRIDGPRAAVIADETCVLDDDAAAAVEERVLPAAPGQTTGQLRAACRRAVLAVDPRAAIRRREKAQKDARVEAWTESSGTGALAGRDLPPAEVIAADQRVDALARWLKEHGAAGTLERLRAGVFTALLAGRGPETLLPESAAPGPAASDDRGVPASGPGCGAGGWGGGGTGPGRAEAARPGAGGPGAGGPGASGPGAGGAVRGGAGPGGAGPGGAGPGDGGAGCWPAGLGGSVNLTMPLAAWLGQTDQPGEAAGLGPLDAWTCRDLARLLAARPGARWCVTLTSPDGRAIGHGCARAGPGPPGSGRPGSGAPGSGPPGPGRSGWLSGITIRWLATGTCAHLRETPGYRPSRALRHLIKIRDRACCFPGCRRQAVRCDDDHTIAYENDGRTCECNLSPLCRRHHQTKQAQGWQLAQTAPGTLSWTLPHGRSYITTPGHYPDE
ncbi:MAG: hypothetical protein ABSB01_20310 [Streptosporangiaceae bacterium]